MTTSDPDLAVAFPAITAAQTAAAAFNVSTAALADMQSLSATLTAAITALQGVMTAKVSSNAPDDLAVYLYAAALCGFLAAIVATIGTFTGSSAQVTVNANGANAYQLVVRYTGDLAGIDDFMAANGLSDPFNIGPGPFVIPVGLITS
jgi:hypothetical protein